MKQSISFRVLCVTGFFVLLSACQPQEQLISIPTLTSTPNPTETQKPSPTFSPTKNPYEIQKINEINAIDFTGADLASNGSFLVYGESKESSLRIIEVESGLEIHRIENIPTPGSIRISNSANLIAFSTEDEEEKSQVMLWDLQTYQPKGSFDIPNSPYQLTFSPDEQFLAARYAYYGDKIILWNLANKKENLFENFSRIVFNPVRPIAAIGNYNEIRIWDLQRNSELAAITPGTETELRDIQFIGDGSKLAFIEQNSIVLWDIDKQEIVQTFSSDSKYLYNALAFSRDDAILAAGREDSRIEFWETATGKSIGQSRSNGSEIDQIIFSPDGILLASKTSGVHLKSVIPSVPRDDYLCFKERCLNMQDQLVELWRTDTLKSVGKIDIQFAGTEDGGVYSLQISTDWRTIVTTTYQSQNTQIAFWKILPYGAG